MRLHRLTLRSVKGVRERTVEFPEHGIVVVEGPNEIGKSTMLEAFDALLSFKSSSKAAEVRGLKPVDRDEGPFVEAELTVGGVRLVYAKRWLRQPSTTLRVLGERPEQLTGDLAQSRVDALLRTHLDRTLYDALRLTQSADGTMGPLSSSTVLTEALDAAAGARLHSEGAEAILDQVEKEYRLYFTGTGRPTGDYRAALNRHTEAQQEVAEAHRRVEEGRDLLERQRVAREAVADADDELADAQQVLREAEGAAVAAEAVAAAQASAMERLSQVRELHRAARRTQEHRTALIAEQRSLTASLEAARAVRLVDVQHAERLQAELSVADAAAARAVMAVEQASEAVEAARADADHLADLRDVIAAESLAGRAAELVERVRRARQDQPLRPVERENARRVRGLQDRLDALVVQHAAASPTVEVESLGASVLVTVADAEGGESVEGGGSRRLSVSHDTTLEVPGQARIRVLLHQEALGRVAEIHEATRRRDHALAEVGVSHVDEVDALADATEAAREALREAVRDVEALLRPLGRAVMVQAAAGTLPDELRERLDLARRRMQDRLAGRAADRPLPEDEETARVAVDRASAALRAAVAAQRDAGSVLTARRKEASTLTRRLDQAAGRLEADEARLRTLTDQLAAVRAESPDEDLAEAVTILAGRVAAATERVVEADAAVARAEVAGVREAHERARGRVRVSTSRREEARAHLHAIGGQVAMAASEGRAELYDQAVAALDEVERDLQALDRRARAARHLRTTLQQHRGDAHRLYVRPYTQALEELGRQVYGRGFAVAVDEQLTLTSRTLDGVTVPYADLSGGAKEQLGILARLAVARLVDRVHGCPVVIDDALGYTDPGRLQQMGDVLGRTVGAGDRVQVILLTCTPDRYAAIPHVQTVRLTA